MAVVRDLLQNISCMPFSKKLANKTIIKKYYLSEIFPEILEIDIRAEMPGTERAHPLVPKGTNPDKAGIYYTSSLIKLNTGYRFALPRLS